MQFSSAEDESLQQGKKNELVTHQKKSVTNSKKHQVAKLEEKTQS
jgi:hypothetical protein